MVKEEHHRKQYDVTSRRHPSARLLKTDEFIAQESSRSTCESDSLKCCCWRFALTNAKGSFERGKFTLKITCESRKLFTTGCRLPHKSTNFGIELLIERS